MSLGINYWSGNCRRCERDCEFTRLALLVLASNDLICNGIEHPSIGAYVIGNVDFNIHTTSYWF